MALHSGNGLGEIVVQAIDGVLVAGLSAADLSVPPHHQTEGFPQGRAVADLLGDDVAGPLEGFLGGIHALFRVNIVLRRLHGVGSAGLLGKQEICQGLETLFPGDGGAGPALLLIGAVDVLQLCQGRCPGNGAFQLRGQLALGFNGGEDGVPALLQATQVL